MLLFADTNTDEYAFLGCHFAKTVTTLAECDHGSQQERFFFALRCLGESRAGRSSVSKAKATIERATVK